MENPVKKPALASPFQSVPECAQFGVYGELGSKHGSETEASLTESTGNALQQTWLAYNRPGYFPLTVVSEQNRTVQGVKANGGEALLC